MLTASFKTIIKFFPTRKMLDSLKVDFIYHGHGIDITNHNLPHSHLWDRLKYERINLSAPAKKAFIRELKSNQVVALFERGDEAKFHIHGMEMHTPETEVYRLESKEIKHRLNLALTLFFLSATSLYFGISHLVNAYI